jgi:site-specific DNA recombinase
MTTKVAIYTRVSTEKQAEKYSLAAQRRILREHAARKGWELVGEYEDPGISGETIEARPAFRSLLEEAGAGAFDVLLTIDTDRLSRSKDLRTWAEILDTLREGGVKIATPTQILDPEDEEDVFLTHLFGILAAREKAKILRRMRRGMEQAVRDGRKMGCSRDPYGYRYDRNLRKLVLEPEEAKIVKRVFDSYLDGQGLLGIVRQFVAGGIPTRKGGPWTPVQLQGILGNPASAGYSVWGRSTRDGERRRRIKNPAEWVWPEEQSHEAIIDLATWQRAQDLRRSRSHGRPALNYQESPHILTGVIRCWCGYRMAGHSVVKKLTSGNVRRRSYRCHAYKSGGENHPLYPSEQVEEQMLTLLSRLGEAPDFLDRARKRVLLDRMRSNTDVAKELDRLRGEVGRSQRKQRILYEDRLEERVTVQQWERFNADLLAEEEELAARARRVEKELLASAGGPTYAAEMLDVLKDFPRLFAKLEPRKRKELVKAIVEEVRVDRDKSKPARIRLLPPWNEFLDHLQPELEAAPEAVRKAL